MPTEIKLWQVEENTPKSVERSQIDYEKHLEDWLRQDIDMVSPDLLVIGQQVNTAYGGFIDLLAIDSSGNLVVLELKKIEDVPREVVAQALDYATWVQYLGYEDVVERGSEIFGGKESFEQAFRDTVWR